MCLKPKIVFRETHLGPITYLNFREFVFLFQHQNKFSFVYIYLFEGRYFYTHNDICLHWIAECQEAQSSLALLRDGLTNTG